jgi:hypothetical protein
MNKLPMNDSWTVAQYFDPCPGLLNRFIEGIEEAKKKAKEACSVQRPYCCSRYMGLRVRPVRVW